MYYFKKDIKILTDKYVKLNGKESTMRFRGYGRFKLFDELQLIAGNDFFTKVAVNYRPIIMPDETGLEPSFPSSHTILALCVCGSSIIINEYIYENKIKGELKLDDNYWLVSSSGNLLNIYSLNVKYSNGKYYFKRFIFLKKKFKFRMCAFI